ncbi:MAG: DUF2085 domain-containing protein [Myxococcales bacterium]|nr:DUF2085 domain-containing protein [Polyangiaceae bacterium]MDW8248585.1 DUF2085 domain-containing protein [Myxococcales bacterium]
MTSDTLPAPPASSDVALRWLAPLLRVVGALLALLPFLPPLLKLVGKEELGERMDGWFEGFCHRIPERSLSLGEEIMPLCSRCLGLAAGGGLGLLIGRPYRGLRVLRIWVSLAAAFLFVELTTQDLGWHPVFHPTRLLSGFLVAYPLGAAATALASLLRTASSVRPAEA